MNLSYTSDNPYRVTGLPTLISNEIAEHGYTFEQLERLSEGIVKAPRWGQLAKGQRLRQFPEPETIAAIAAALGLPTTTVVLATASYLGLQVRQGQNTLATMLPAGVERLPIGVVRSVVKLIAVLVDQNEQDLPRRPAPTPKPSPRSAEELFPEHVDEIRARRADLQREAIEREQAEIARRDRLDRDVDEAAIEQPPAPPGQSEESTT